ncbi:CLUMA_CG007300, isoform A [Clunio marinus]|uniref:CLUMA_CG007300, isoform A n=1 Tax=Clunio marinus TaxID=568069 RepID=A0A1J1I2E9_9DIPT|nr:CLUMA_CG007300, isoform A [Clunio marinus]
MSQLENIEIKVNNEVDKIETNTNEQRVDNAVKQETESNKETKEAVIEEPIKAFQVPVAFNVISAPRVCPPGYRMDSKGKCRKVL